MSCLHRPNNYRGVWFWFEKVRKKSLMVMHVRFTNPWSIPLFINIYSKGTGGVYNPTPLVSQLLDMVWFWNLYQRYPLWNDDIGDDLSDWVTWLMCNLQARSRFLMLSQILKMTLSITFFYQRYILWKV